MFQWSKKVVKSATFNPGVADESLLALVESHLEKHPQKTFSDLCKEALWQLLCVPESVRPGPKTVAVEEQIAELQRHLTDIEARFFAKESHRLESMESQLMQLSQQVAQLAIMLNQRSGTQPPIQSASTAEVLHTTHTTATTTPPQEVDPLLSRLSQYLDDF